MSILDNFKNDISAFLEKSGMSRTAFGDGAIKDPNLLRDLDEGRAPSAKTMQRVYDFMSSEVA